MADGQSIHSLSLACVGSASGLHPAGALQSRLGALNVIVSSAALSKVLGAVLETPISPELIPPDADQISQLTEDLVGPYELHDFFLYHFLRNGSGAKRIFSLACLAFGEQYPAQTIKHWLGQFFKRFMTQQFKRTTLPPGPKVGSVSLSPRGDWRMPDEAGYKHILEEIENLL